MLSQRVYHGATLRDFGTGRKCVARDRLNAYENCGTFETSRVHFNTPCLTACEFGMQPSVVVTLCAPSFDAPTALLGRTTGNSVIALRPVGPLPASEWQWDGYECETQSTALWVDITPPAGLSLESVWTSLDCCFAPQQCSSNAGNNSGTMATQYFDCENPPVPPGPLDWQLLPGTSVNQCPKNCEFGQEAWVEVWFCDYLPINTQITGRAHLSNGSILPVVLSPMFIVGGTAATWRWTSNCMTNGAQLVRVEIAPVAPIQRIHAGTACCDCPPQHC